MPKAATRKKVGDWTTQSALVLATRKKSTALNVTCMLTTDARWTAVAVATPAKTASNVNAVLDAHSHQVIGTFVDMPTCILAVEDWVRAWQPAATDCPCDEITPAKSVRRSVRRPARSGSLGRASAA